MIVLPFYNALYGINYRLPNVTFIVEVGIYSVVRIVNRGATMILPINVAMLPISLSIMW